MRKLLLAGLAGMMMAGPALADGPGDFRGDRREYREDRRDFREDRRDFREDRRDFRDDRREYWRDQRDFRNDRRADWRWDRPRWRAPAYRYPRGYAYRPYGIGIALPGIYYGGNYWINNWGYYRLPPPLRGTRWIRVGPDALLVNIATGIVLQAVRDLYY